MRAVEFEKHRTVASGRAPGFRSRLAELRARLSAQQEQYRGELSNEAGASNHLPTRVCDGNNDQLSGAIRSNGFPWFDPSCFPLPSAGYFGNSGRTVVAGPGIDNRDVGLHKSLPLGQSARLQFRAEAFNAWNHAQFRAPNGDSGADRTSAAYRPHARRA